jgi:hypothetical protein
MSDVEVATTMNAAAATAYRLVSDVTRMGQWSPETTSCRWVDGAAGPAVGARFRGTNSYRMRRWTTTCTVTAAEPGTRFAFDVHYAGIPISQWEYRIDGNGATCTVTESWTDRRPGWMRLVGGAVMGTGDRGAHNRRGMTQTLERLKAAAESGSAG